MLAALAKFRKDTSSPLRMFDYFREFRSLVASNVPPADLIKLAQLGRRLDPAHVKNLVLPGAGGSAGGASVVFLSPATQGIFSRVRDDGVL